jgi:4'-phosphopantetheinyl transferase EntD
MPLHRVDTIRDDVRLALWRMTDDDDLLSLSGQANATEMHAAARRREVQVTHALLHLLTGDGQLRVEHDASRKPLVEGWKISISHTRGWGAVILSRRHEVAVDIEYQSNRVSRVVERFMRPDENSDGLSRQLIGWSAKETVYKYYSADNLKFFEMRLLPYPLESRGTLKVENLRRGETLQVAYEINSDFVLTYAVGV